METFEIDFSYYFNLYCGGRPLIADSVQFDRCAKKAVGFLNTVVCRGQGSFLESTVCDCLCAMAEDIFKAEQRAGIRHENIDGYSVTFAPGEDISATLFKTAKLYLGNTGLLFAGVE